MHFLRTFFSCNKKPIFVLAVSLILFASTVAIYSVSKAGATSAGVCSNGSYTNQGDCIVDRSYCSNFSYNDQISCEESGVCSDMVYSDATSCLDAMCGEIPGSCSDESSSDQSTCVSAMCGGVAAYCSDPVFTDQNSCEQAMCGSAAYCSNVSYSDQLSCESAVCGGSMSGSCSGGGYVDQPSCESAQCNNDAYYCSGEGYTDQNSCEQAMCGGVVAYCSDNSYYDQITCEANGNTWYAEVLPQNCGYTWNYSGGTVNCGYVWTSGPTETSCGYSWTEGTYANCGNIWHPETLALSCGYTWTEGTPATSCNNTWTPNIWNSVSGSTWSKLAIVGPIQSQDVSQSSWSQIVNIDWGVYDSGSCEYSYNNTNWTLVDCALNGINIPVNQNIGNTTLFVKNSIFGSVQYDNRSFNIISDIAGNSTSSTSSESYIPTTGESGNNQVQNLSLAPTSGGSVGGGPSFGYGTVGTSVFPSTTTQIISNNVNSTGIPIYRNGIKSDLSAILSKLAFFILPAKQGTESAEVEKLQRFLNTHGFMVAKSGPGSPGKETSYFGPATKKALVKFQKSVGIVPSVGIFGPVTKAYINKYYTNVDFEEESN